jgi:bifunctional non-homologous end joining protein LigD
MFSPMLAQSAPGTMETIQRLDKQGGWFYDLKIDGVRGILAINNGRVTITNRNGVDITGRYPEIAAAALDKYGDAFQLILDGEVVVFDDEGKPSFKLTSKRDRQQKPAVIEALSKSLPATFVAFDVLWDQQSGGDVRSTAWDFRHDVLDRRVKFGDDSPRIRMNVGSENGEAMLAMVLEHGFEGLVAKRRDSIYQSGRRSQWQKIKPTKTASLLVTGSTVGTGSRRETFGALSLAVLRSDGSLRPVGEVGTGFKQKDLHEVLGLLQAGGDLIVEVEYLEFTVDGALRFPVYKGIRTDLSRTDCTEGQLV